MRGRWGLRPTMAVVVVLAAACGGTATTDGTQTVGTSTGAATADPGTPAPGPGPGSPTSPAPTGSAVAADQPGEEVLGPVAGASLAVVGVAADDTLNVRAAPGTDRSVVAQLDPLADDVVVTGEARLVGDAVWYAVEEGWVNARFLAYLGETTDLTSELAERPTAATMTELADLVATLRMPSGEEDSGAWSVVSDGPSVGDLGEVTVDVVGLPDDAIRGERLHVFANPAEDGAGFALRTVERTLLCARGVSEGLCV